MGIGAIGDDGATPPQPRIAQNDAAGAFGTDNKTPWIGAWSGARSGTPARRWIHDRAGLNLDRLGGLRPEYSTHSQDALAYPVPLGRRGGLVLSVSVRAPAIRVGIAVSRSGNSSLSAITSSCTGCYFGGAGV